MKPLLINIVYIYLIIKITQQSYRDILNYAEKICAVIVWPVTFYQHC